MSRSGESYVSAVIALEQPSMGADGGADGRCDRMPRRRNPSSNDDVSPTREGHATGARSDRKVISDQTWESTGHLGLLGNVLPPCPLSC